MTERGWGRIIFVGSTCGLVGVPYTAAYSASKHAVIGLMRVTAAELAGSGVTANAVCPTYVESEMTDRSIRMIAKSTGVDLASARTTLERSSPLGRLLRPAEVADAVAFLSTDSAASINGQALVMDGGGIQH
jgi:NAD(P)-dependent dehydrogenase (short-subunit alcohol dehydrogenase family)